jgi:hypothetical protein
MKYLIIFISMQAMGMEQEVLRALKSTQQGKEAKIALERVLKPINLKLIAVAEIAYSKKISSKHIKNLEFSLLKGKVVPNLEYRLAGEFNSSVTFTWVMQ